MPAAEIVLSYIHEQIKRNSDVNTQIHGKGLFNESHVLEHVNKFALMNTKDDLEVPETTGLSIRPHKRPVPAVLTLGHKQTFLGPHQ